MNKDFKHALRVKSTKIITKNKNELYLFVTTEYGTYEYFIGLKEWVQND